MSQPPNSAKLAPSSRWRSSNGPCSRLSLTANHTNRGVGAGRLGWVVDLDALEAAGIANVRERSALLEYLDGLGFTAEEMVEAERRGRLFGLAGDALQRSGRPTYSLRTAA